MNDELEIIDKLKSELEMSSWALIASHHERQMVYVLKKPNDLVQTAMHIANNKVHIIKAMMDTQELYRPSKDEVDLWTKTPEKKFYFLIVQPFVLIQE